MYFIFENLEHYGKTSVCSTSSIRSGNPFRPLKILLRIIPSLETIFKIFRSTSFFLFLEGCSFDSASGIYSSSNASNYMTPLTRRHQMGRSRTSSTQVIKNI